MLAGFPNGVQGLLYLPSTELLCTCVSGCVLCSYEPAALYWQAVQGEFIMNMWPIWSCLALKGGKEREKKKGRKMRARA